MVSAGPVRIQPLARCPARVPCASIACNRPVCRAVYVEILSICLAATLRLVNPLHQALGALPNPERHPSRSIRSLKTKAKSVASGCAMLAASPHPAAPSGRSSSGAERRAPRAQPAQLPCAGQGAGGLRPSTGAAAGMPRRRASSEADLHRQQLVEIGAARRLWKVRFCRRPLERGYDNPACAPPGQGKPPSAV